MIKIPCPKMHKYTTDEVLTQYNDDESIELFDSTPVIVCGAGVALKKSDFELKEEKAYRAVQNRHSMIQEDVPTKLEEDVPTKLQEHKAAEKIKNDGITKLCNLCGDTKVENFQPGRNSRCKKCRSKTDYMRKLQKEQTRKEMEKSCLSIEERDKFISFMKTDITLYENFTPLEITQHHHEQIIYLTEKENSKDVLINDLCSRYEYINKEFLKATEHIFELESLVKNLMEERNQIKSELDSIKSILGPLSLNSKFGDKMK